MTRAIWSGQGELPREAAYFTTNNGELKGRDYLRQRVRSYLSRWRTIYTADERRAAIRATVESDLWLASRSGCLIVAVCRDVETALLRAITPNTET